MTRSRLRTITITAATFAVAGLAAFAAGEAAAASTPRPSAGMFATILCTSFDPGDGACEEWPGDPDRG